MWVVSTVSLGRWCPVTISPYGVYLEVCGLGLAKMAVLRSLLECSRWTARAPASPAVRWPSTRRSSATRAATRSSCGSSTDVSQVQWTLLCFTAHTQRDKTKYNKSRFSLVPRLSTWHCPHLLLSVVWRVCCWALTPASDRYLLPERYIDPLLRILWGQCRVTKYEKNLFKPYLLMCFPQWTTLYTSLNLPCQLQ